MPNDWVDDGERALKTEKRWFYICTYTHTYSNYTHESSVLF